MKVFLSGIAGTGMSALAGLFSEKGYEVLGSDTSFYAPVDKILEKMNAELFSSYDEKNIPADVDSCIIGNVISRGNPEAEYILDNGIAYYSMAEALYQFFIKGKHSIVVAGSHGKTTIASFIAHLLDQAGMQPGFFIGGKPKNFSANYALGAGDFFVSEGDEYETAFFDRSSKFLKYHARYLILSALEYDHLDFFPSEDLYRKSFENLVNQVPQNGLIVSNNDFTMNRRVVENSFTPVKTYGEKGADFVIKDICWQGDHYTFSVKGNGTEMILKTALPGRYNIANLCAGIMLGLHLGIPQKTIGQAVETFAGVERRLNLINSKGQTIFLEDFAHHPTAIKSVLQSLRESYPQKRIITLFEPRSWSLRRNFFQDRLADSLCDSDEVVIKEVFQKEKIPQEQRLDVHKIRAELERRGKRALVAERIEEIEEYLVNLDIHADNLVLLISNGSFDNLPAFVKDL